MKLYVDEAGSASVREAVAQTPIVATSAIAYVEARAAFARKRHDGGLSSDDQRRVIRDLDDDWHRYVRLGVAEALLRDAAELAEAHRLRAYDAVHLASAKVARSHTGDPVIFASWDADLGAAAAREGFEAFGARRR